MDLPIDPDTQREIKPITPPDYNFKIQFRCNDDRCSAKHIFSVRDWEPDALYFNLKCKRISQTEAAEKVVQKLHDICSSDKDLYFFLGNISSHPNIFTIVGLWYPKKNKESNQQVLFKL